MCQTFQPTADLSRPLYRPLPPIPAWARNGAINRLPPATPPPPPARLPPHKIPRHRVYRHKICPYKPALTDPRPTDGPQPTTPRTTPPSKTPTKIGCGGSWGPAPWRCWGCSVGSDHSSRCNYPLPLPWQTRIIGRIDFIPLRLAGRVHYALLHGVTSGFFSPKNGSSDLSQCLNRRTTG